MDIIGLIGIVLGLAVFIFCCAKNVNTLIAGFIGSFIIILTSGGNILDGVTTTWVGGFTGFLKQYFLLFALGSLFGKCLSEAGGSRRIAIAVYHLCSKSKKNKRFVTALFVPIMYMILSYVGISGFVIIYTVLDIAKHVYRKNDVPWRMITYGGGSCVLTMMLPGNLQLVNVAAGTITGTNDVAAAPLMGFVGAGLCLVFHLIIIHWDVKRSEKRGEGFMTTGSEFVAADTDADDLDEDLSKLPSLIQSLIPMVAMIILAAVVKLNIVICLVVGIVLCFVVMPGRIKAPLNTITLGVTNSLTTVLGVASANAVGTCLKASIGFPLIMGALGSVPSVMGGCIMLIVMCFATASSTGGLNAVGAEAFALFTGAGLSPAVSHRLMTMCMFSSIPPQSAGIVNTTNICKLKYKDSVWQYLRLNFLGDLPAFLIVFALLQFGVFG